MTYRERRQRRAERLRGWAGKRQARSEAALAAAHNLADQIPFGQPILVGHHSERHARRDAARIDANMRAGFEHASVAERMSERADNIERAAAHAIYSDDPDAIEALRARISEMEARRESIKAFNAAVRKAGRATEEALALLSEHDRTGLLMAANAGQVRNGTMPAYVLSNLAGNIGRQRDRLARLETKS